VGLQKASGSLKELAKLSLLGNKVVGGEYPHYGPVLPAGDFAGRQAYAGSGVSPLGLDQNVFPGKLGAVVSYDAGVTRARDDEETLGRDEGLEAL
jgi:hypothetical protein